MPVNIDVRIKMDIRARAILRRIRGEITRRDPTGSGPRTWLETVGILAILGGYADLVDPQTLRAATEILERIENKKDML